MAAQALQESELRFRTAFEHAPIGMALVAVDGGWVKVNESFWAFLGYSEDELRRTTWQALIHPDDLQADLASVRDTLTGGSTATRWRSATCARTGGPWPGG